MRILLTCHIRHVTGEIRAVRELAEGLRARGHEVVVACPSDGALHRRLVAAGVPVIDLSFRRGELMRAARTIARIARERAIDVVDAHGGRDRKAVLLARLLFRLRAGVVVTRRAYSASFPLQNLLYAVVADRVVAISEAVAERLARRGMWRGRVAVVRPGFAPERLAGDVATAELVALRRELGLDEALPTIGMVARRKDQETLLRAAARLGRRSNVLFVGLERDAALAALETALPQGSRVVYAGFRERVEPFFALMDVAVLATRGEGLSQAALEALAAGVPLAAAAVGGVPEVVVHEQSGLLFRAGDADALARCIARLLDDAPLRERVVSVGRERVRTVFGIERMLSETENVYAAVLPATTQMGAGSLAARNAAL